MERLYKYRCPRCGYYLEREELFEYLKAECTYNTDVPVPVKCYPVEQSKNNQNENQNPNNCTAVEPDSFSNTEMINFHNIDCMEFMAGLPDKAYDLAVVDPPYGVGRDEGFGGFGGFGKPIKRKKYKGWGDEQTPNQNYFDELKRVAVNYIIWGGNFFTDKLPVSGHWIFWDKQNTMPTFGDGELAYTSFDRKSVKRVIIQYNGLLGNEPNRIHATQKPVKLYRWLLHNYAKPGDRILDTHGGSMSIAIACDMEGFDLDVCEIDKDYFDAAVKRFNQYKAQLKLFDQPATVLK